MEKELKYKGKLINKIKPSGMFEFRSEKEGKFLKFDTLQACKAAIDKELKSIKESKESLPKIKISELRELVKNILKEDKDPCWDGYEQIGMKEKKGKEVPNCVPIKESNEDLVDYVIPDWALPALINGDYSGLEDIDEQKINKFIDEVVSIHGNAHFMGGDEDLGFCPRNDIDKLGSNCYRLYIRPSKMEESVKPKTHKIKLSEVRSLVRKTLKESKQGYETYHDSFTSAAEDARNFAEGRGFVINEDDWQSQVALGGRYGRSRPAIGKSHTFTVGLSKDGKEQRKALTFTVYGMESGKYELVAYIN